MTKPPSNAGATLSACRAPLAKDSPSKAKGINSSGRKPASSNSFTPTTAAAALAALEPMPLPGRIDLKISISNPQGLPRDWSKLFAAMEATLRSGCMSSAAP